MSILEFERHFLSGDGRLPEGPGACLGELGTSLQMGGRPEPPLSISSSIREAGSVSSAAQRVLEKKLPEK